MEQSAGARARVWAGDAVVKFAESARDVLLERLTRPTYDDAAHVTLGVVTKHIEALDQKVESGARVSQQDHYLNKKLRDIRSEMEQALDDRWVNRGPE